MMTTPIFQPIFQPVFQDVAEPRPWGRWSPSLLFAAGEQGAWYDPGDMTTLFQDSAGTTPVTAPDQPIGLMRDKSGRGNHASQVTAGSRPILRTGSGLWWLEFDGVDDCLITSSIPFSADKMCVAASLRKTSDAAIGTVLELSDNINTNNGTFIFLAPPNAAAASYTAGFKGTVRVDRLSLASYAAPITNVVSGIGDISAASTKLRINGVEVSSGVVSLGAGNFGSYPLYIGRRGGATLPFVGNLYSIVVRNSAMSAADMLALDKFSGLKCGVSI